MTHVSQTDGAHVFPDDHDQRGTFSPEELCLIHEMMNAAVAECGVSAPGDTAHALGRAVIRLFRNGVRDPAIAAQMLTKTFKRA